MGYDAKLAELQQNYYDACDEVDRQIANWKPRNDGLRTVTCCHAVDELMFAIERERSARAALAVKTYNLPVEA